MGARTLLSMPLQSDGDVVTVRMTARRVAEMVGFDRNAQTRLATAVSEIARNAVAHGGGGHIDWAVDDVDAPKQLRMLITDGGPGIARLDEVLAGQVPMENGRGRGLPSARRLVDWFEIESRPGAGTRVLLAQRIPREAAGRLSRQVQQDIASISGFQPVDPMAALSEQNRELIDSMEVLQERQEEAERLNRELEDTNRGVVALYSELDDKAEQLRQVSDLKSRFLSHMSHEFRTPLGSILALARLLSDRVDGNLTPEQERQVDYIRRSAQGLLDLVNDLLDLAKVEAGKLDIKPTNFDVEELFGSLRGSLKPLQTNPAVDLIFEDASHLPTMLADEARVTQVLRNFISNALKFTERGSVHVSARHKPSTAQIVFSVEDSGIGIAAEHQRIIFDEFSQVEGRLQKGGTGLGLSLARRLATLLGGEVAVASELGKGSVFTLVVPVRWGDRLADGRPRMPGQLRVLVVDDEESFRYVIRHIAQDGGFTVLEAEDGVAGLRVAREAQPDIIILDLQMPVLDGYSMLAGLQDDASLNAIPVIVCTSQVLSLDKRRSLAGAYAIVPKHDLSRDGLTALIHAALPRAALGEVDNHG